MSVAKQLREDLISYCNTVPEHKWPPNFESVTAEFEDPPGSDRTNREKGCRIIDSLTSDFIHNISIGKIITPKHYLSALGLHNLTGQKQPVVIANKLWHCMSCDLCYEVETSK